ncbi:MAG: hypothetical protein R2867_24930 [Caldilineaceae bacterium]
MIAISLLLTVTIYSRTNAKVLWAQSETDYPIYVPILLNKAGWMPPPESFDLVYADGAGAWLSSLDGKYKSFLGANVQYGIEDDIPVVRAAPGGSYVAVQYANGWTIYQRNTLAIAAGIGQGFALAWDQPQHTNDVQTGQMLTSLLLSKKGTGINRWTLANQQSTPLLVTSDDTSDHSPLWDASGARLFFAHHEFGGTLYVTMVKQFSEGLLPYAGENRDAVKINDEFTLLEEVDSWHDQPIAFHLSADQQKLIFAAKQTIYVVDLTTKAAVTITPPGFGEKEAGRSVDFHNDQILYGAADGIYVVGLSGHGDRRVVEGSNLHYPQWTASGEQIVYRGTDNRLYVVDADGSNSHVIPYTAAVKQFDILK